MATTEKNMPWWGPLLYLLGFVVLVAGSWLFGILIILLALSITPYFSKLIYQKTKYLITGRTRVILGLIFLFLFIIGLLIPEPTIQDNNTVNLKGKSAEEVFDIYLNHFGYNSISGGLKNLAIQKQLPEEYLAESKSADYNYTAQLMSKK